MIKSEHYCFPAIFYYEPNQEIAVVFPDLHCATSGTNDADALLSAKELLLCVLHGMKDDKKTIPSPTPLSKINIQDNEHAVLIDVRC